MVDAEAFGGGFTDEVDVDSRVDVVGKEGWAVCGVVLRVFPRVERATGSVKVSDLSKQRARKKSVQVC